MIARIPVAGLVAAACLALGACGKPADGAESQADPSEVPAAAAAQADKVTDVVEAELEGSPDAAAEAAAPAGEAKLPADAPVAKAPAPAADKAAIAAGAATFANNCASCHGEGGSGGFGPALTNLAARADKRPVADIIRKPMPGMPPLYPAMLTDQDVAEVAAYLDSIQ